MSSFQRPKVQCVAFAYPAHLALLIVHAGLQPRPVRALPGRPGRREPGDDRLRVTVAGHHADLATYEALAARTLQMALSPTLPAQLTTMIVPGVAASEHIDQAWAFAVAHRDALMKDQDAIGQNQAFSDIVASSSNPNHADRMEHDVKEHFGPDALVEAQRVGNGIRIRAALKSRLLP